MGAAAIRSPRILLACYEFPPSPGIGARRWSKLAKGMAAAGARVDVLCAEPVEGGSPWIHDVEQEGIRVHPLPRVYPDAVARPRRSLLGRIGYRLAVRRLRRTTPGTIFDKAVGFDAAFLPAARRLLDAGDVDAVVATGAPFNLLVFAATLAAEYPDVVYLADYRDPWIGAANYGMSGLEPARLDVELEKQRRVFAEADVVTAPCRFMLEKIRSSDPRGRLEGARTEPLHHFFDPDDHPEAEREPTAPGPELRLVYGGDLYSGLDATWPRVLVGLDRLRETAPDVYERLEIEVYSSATGRFPTLDRHRERLRFLPSIGREIFERIRTASAALLFVAEHNKDFLTTKFYDYLPCRRPYVVVGPRGHVAEHVEAQRLGIGVDDPAAELAEAILAVAEGRAAFPDDYDVAAHALPVAARRVLDLIETAKAGERGS